MSLAEVKNIDRADWEVFSKNQRDKVSIEHILPQTMEDPYWIEKFEAYDEKEKRNPCQSLGNLLLLAHSINASLQNISFPQKKNPRDGRRRGYSHGSHSEIEVAAYEDWTGEAILERGKKTTRFYGREIESRLY